MVQMLLTEGNANPNISDKAGVCPLHLAAFDENGSSICVSLLVSYGADVNTQTRGKQNNMNEIKNNKNKY
jgi:ankyrin repeat protein